jgi:acyl-coenzyme A thioesterase PaaI-like protein
MPPGAAVLSIEFKVNLLAPGKGDRFIARGRVIRAGRNVTVTWGDVVAYEGENERVVATLVGTMMTVSGRGLSD